MRNAKTTWATRSWRQSGAGNKAATWAGMPKATPIRKKPRQRASKKRSAN